MDRPRVVHHLCCQRGDVGRYVLLPGDPGRCERIAGHLEDAHLVARNREYTVYTGTLLEEQVSVCSTGIGGPSTAIAVEELAAVGADTLIRVGTSGGMQPETRVGDLVVVSAAVRDEGTSHQYMYPAYPAVADLDVTLALAMGAERQGARYHVGIGQCKDSFYGEIEPERMPLSDELVRRWHAWVAGGCLCSEMEAATLYVVARILQLRAGGIMLVGGANADLYALARMSQEERRRVLANLAAQHALQGPHLLDRLITAAVAGLQVLIEHDREQRHAG